MTYDLQTTEKIRVILLLFEGSSCETEASFTFCNVVERNP